MLIYAYADILGYRQMLSDWSVSELHAVLEGAVTETHRMLDRYTNSKPVAERYRSALYDQADYLQLLLDNDLEQLGRLRQETSGRVPKLKTYIASDTIVVYWDELVISEAMTTLFLLAIDLLYLVLYERGILIRGAIGTTDDYFIGEDGSERLFIIKNIGTAASIEKNQDCANLIVFGEDLRDCLCDAPDCGLTDDHFARLDYYPDEARYRVIQMHPDRPRAFFKDGFVKRVMAGEERGVSLRDVFEENPLGGRMTCITICPINNLTFVYLGLDSYENLYKKVRAIHDKGPGESHESLLQYNTACLLYARLNSGMYNATRIMPIFGEELHSELPVERSDLMGMWEELRRRVGKWSTGTCGRNA